MRSADTLPVVLRVATISIALLATVLAAGCYGPPRENHFELAAASYPAAFDAARDVLVSHQFALDRVDAGAGVITTLPKESSGLATPWDDVQSSLEQEWTDLVNRQLRRVRITFEPRQPEPDLPADGPVRDLRTNQSPMVARVQVIVDRVRRPGWRLESRAIRESTHTHDPSLDDRGLWPAFATPDTQDTLLAGRLAEEIARRTAQP